MSAVTRTVEVDVRCVVTVHVGDDWGNRTDAEVAEDLRTSIELHLTGTNLQTTYPLIARPTWASVLTPGYVLNNVIAEVES